MTQILEFRNKEKKVILRAALNMEDLNHARKRIQVGILAEELEAKEVAITIKDNNEKYYFIGVYNV